MINYKDLKNISGICVKGKELSEGLRLLSNTLNIPVYRIYDFNNDFQVTIQNLITDIENRKINCIIVNEIEDVLKTKTAIEFFIKEVVIRYDIRLIITNKDIDFVPSELLVEEENLFNIIKEEIVGE